MRFLKTTPCAQVDYGRALVQDKSGSTLAEVRKGGEVLGHWGATCGRLDGFDFSMLRARSRRISRRMSRR